MAYPRKRPYSRVNYTARHADITVATASAYAVITAQGSLVRVSVVTEGAITGANETLNVYKNGVDTTYDITVVQDGAAAGDVFSVDINPDTVPVADGDYLTLVSANASGGTIAAAVTYEVQEN